MGIGQGNAGESQRWRVANLSPQPGAKIGRTQKNAKKSGEMEKPRRRVQVHAGLAAGNWM